MEIYLSILGITVFFILVKCLNEFKLQREKNEILTSMLEQQSNFQLELLVRIRELETQKPN